MPRNCEYCGCPLDENDVYIHDNVIMCADCYDDNTRECGCCNRRIWNDDDEGDDNVTLCASCRENNYTTCESCGRLIHENDAYYDDDDDYPYGCALFSGHPIYMKPTQNGYFLHVFLHPLWV